MSRSLRLLVLVAVIALGAGCAKTYVVTKPLDAALAAPATIIVGAITDELPIDTEEAKKPRQSDIDKFQRFLGEEIAKKQIGQIVPGASPDAQYEVRGRFLEFKRGSGAARFFIGFGVGSAKAVIGLDLVDKKSGEVIFAGNFTGAVSSWAEGGDQAFKRIASSFAKELEKQLKSVKSVS